MAYHPNHSMEDMVLEQHYSDTDNNSVFLRMIPPSAEDHHLAHSSHSAGKDHWLNSAILQQQGRFLQTNTNNLDSSQLQHNNNQWLSRSRNVVSDVRGPEDSIIAVMSSRNSPDLNNHSINVALPQVDSNVGGESDGALMNWQKAEILSHPLFEQLLAAHVSCLRIATPVDQLPRIDAQLAQSQQVFLKYNAAPLANNLDDDVTHHKELHQFMTHYVLLLCSFKEQLQQHVRVHAMEAVMACWEIEQSLQSVTGVSPGEGTGSTMSDDDDDDDDEDQVDRDSNVFNGHESIGFGPLIPTESETSLMECVRQELKHDLKQGYKEKIIDIREEILRKRRAGKLPGDTTYVLKSWWQSHAKWPYPTEEDKAQLVQETGLQLKQINNWFINQRKRNWHNNPSSSTDLKSKRRASNRLNEKKKECR